MLDKFGENLCINDNVSVENNTLKSKCSNEVDLALLRSLISSMQADILSIKRTHINTFREEIKSVKSEIKTDLADTVVEAKNSLTEIQHLAERVTDNRPRSKVTSDKPERM